VVRQSTDPARIRSAQLVGLAPRVAVVVAVLGSGAIDKHTIEFSDELSEAQLTAASSHLARCLVGQTVGGTVMVPATGDGAVDQAVAAAVSALFHRGADADTHPQVFVGGAARMATAFDTVDTIRQVLDILEQQFVLVTLIKDVLDRGLSVSIGAEHGVQSLADCSIVIAPYEVEGERAGTVGILGPTRMHYEQALAAVAVVSRRLGKALSEGGAGG
jgi:heat-inducible transcriptional repressor